MIVHPQVTQPHTPAVCCDYLVYITKKGGTGPDFSLPPHPYDLHVKGRFLKPCCIQALTSCGKPQNTSGKWQVCRKSTVPEYSRIHPLFAQCHIFIRFPLMFLPTPLHSILCERPIVSAQFAKSRCLTRGHGPGDRHHLPCIRPFFSARQYGPLGNVYKQVMGN